MERDLKQKAVSGILWRLLDNGGAMGVQFIASILLARIVDPSDYSPLTLTVILLSIATILVQRGFRLALIQRLDVTDVDDSTVLFLGLGIAAVLYLVFFVTSPLLAAFFEEPRLVQVLRVQPVILFFNASESVQYAIISRRMEFAKISRASLFAVILSGAVAVALASLGLGTWALVAQQVLFAALLCSAEWAQTRWRPRLTVSLPRARILFSYGWKLLLSAVANTLFLNAAGLVIGKVDSPELLTQYTKGRQFPQLIEETIDTSLHSALFPAYAIEQNAPGHLLSMLRRQMSATAFVVTPLLAGLAAVATPMVTVVLTKKWLPAVPFLRIACVAYILLPLANAGVHALDAKGRSDVTLRLNFIKTGFGVLLLLLAMLLFRSAQSVAWAIALDNLLAVAINVPVLKKELGYSVRSQLYDILPSLTLSAAMGVGVYALSLLRLAVWPTLLLQVAAGVLFYIAAARFLRLEPMAYLLRSAREFLQKRRSKSPTDPT